MSEKLSDRERIAALGLSQTELHKSLGVEEDIPYTGILDYEFRKNEPTLIVLMEYARIAGSMRKHGRLFGPFRGLRFLLLDRFGFVANRPIRSASVWPSELLGQYCL